METAARGCLPTPHHYANLLCWSVASRPHAPKHLADKNSLEINATLWSQWTFYTPKNLKMKCKHKGSRAVIHHSAAPHLGTVWVSPVYPMTTRKWQLLALLRGIIPWQSFLFFKAHWHLFHFLIISDLQGFWNSTPQTFFERFSKALQGGLEAEQRHIGHTFGLPVSGDLMTRKN